HRRRQRIAVMITATITTTTSPASNGNATRRHNASGSVPVSDALISVTAATGDMVRPAAAASDTTAQTCARLTAGSARNAGSANAGSSAFSTSHVSGAFTMWNAGDVSIRSRSGTSGTAALKTFTRNGGSPSATPGGGVVASDCGCRRSARTLSHQNSSVATVT